MMCLGIEPGAAGWKARTNPLSYGGTPPLTRCLFAIQPSFLRGRQLFPFDCFHFQPFYCSSSALVLLSLNLPSHPRNRNSNMAFKSDPPLSLSLSLSLSLPLPLSLLSHSHRAAHIFLSLSLPHTLWEVFLLMLQFFQVEFSSYLKLRSPSIKPKHILPKHYFNRCLSLSLYFYPIWVTVWKKKLYMAVVVAQLVEQLLPIPVIFSLNHIIGNFYLLSVVWESWK